VLSYDLAEDAVVVAKVQRTFNHIAREGYYEIGIQQDTLSATGEHPFFVLGAGWQTVKNLKKGDNLLSKNNGAIPVREVVRRVEHIRVYNLSVDQEHNYFVGRHRVLVHNKQ